MQAIQLISPDQPVLSPADKISKAVDYFLETTLCHFPVVSDGILEGILPAEVVMEVIDKNLTIADFKNDWIQAFAFRDHHGLDVFEIASKYELTSIPVVDEEKKYLGTIVVQDLLSRLSSIHSFKEVGGIIVLSMAMRDYDLAEVARIVESNDAKILISYLDMDAQNEQVKLTIKVNTLDLRHILATFDRFRYVVEFFEPQTADHDELKERYNLLMKLFDI